MVQCARACQKDDGRVNPVDACVALSKGAKMHGAKVVEGVRVAGVTRDSRGTTVTGVVTEGGRTIRAKKVVNCAGMWARQLAEQAGVVCPNQAAEHYYLVTDSMPEVCWPLLQDCQDACISMSVLRECHACVCNYVDCCLVLRLANIGQLLKTPQTIRISARKVVA